MRDKVARGDIYLIKDRLGCCERDLSKLEDCAEVCTLSVRDCPVCKHETLQKKRRESKLVQPPGWAYYRKETDAFDWLCLTCGSKLVCETECKVVKKGE